MTTTRIPSTVAVFTENADVTADYVVRELNERGVTVFRCDPGDFPVTIAMAARSGACWTGRLDAGGRSLALDDVVCAWWRRPNRMEPDSRAAEPAWAAREARAGFHGLMSVLPWLNRPDDIRRAEHKPLQLAAAAVVGLAVPPTLLTNDPDEVRAFAKEHGELIYKPLCSGGLSDHRMIYASRVAPDAVDDGVRLSAHLFQPEIPKDHELRVTLVDDRPFVARIDATSDAARRDWRADYASLTYTADELPAGLLGKLRAYAHRMRLRFLAADIIVTPAGDHVFLEANPNGQWVWIEDATGLPIAAAIADALEGRTP
jgi:ATP-grasp ribosomal peptide maturase